MFKVKFHFLKKRTENSDGLHVNATVAVDSFQRNQI